MVHATIGYKSVLIYGNISMCWMSDKFLLGIIGNKDDHLYL